MARADRQWGGDDPAEARTVAARQHLHEQLQNDVEAFLARGGQIQYLEPYETGETPVFNRVSTQNDDNELDGEELTH